MICFLQVGEHPNREVVARPTVHTEVRLDELLERRPCHLMRLNAALVSGFRDTCGLGVRTGYVVGVVEADRITAVGHYDRAVRVYERNRINGDIFSLQIDRAAFATVAEFTPSL